MPENIWEGFLSGDIVSHISSLIRRLHPNFGSGRSRQRSEHRIQKQARMPMPIPPRGIGDLCRAKALGNGPGAGGMADLARGGAGGASPLKALLEPYPSERMTCWPVSARVGNVKNNDPSLIETIAAE